MIGKIKGIDLRKIWKNEATDFTPWLEENLEHLSDAVGIELNLIKRELSVGPFSADIVAHDDSGEKVIIENQLERTDHTHLGQILTYVANLQAKTVLWISSEPRQEHINAINWLNSQTEVNFYLVRVAAVVIDESPPAPLFQVICKPDQEIRKASVHDSELSDRGKFNISFWTEMNERCASVLPGFLSRKPSKYPFHAQATGRAGFSFVFLVTSRYYGVELYIDMKDGDQNEAALQQLKAARKKIESSFGHELEFDDIPEKRACRIRFKIGDGVDVMELDRAKIQAELIDHMVRFQQAIKPLLKTVDTESVPSAA